MKKKLALSALALMITGTLSGCGNSSMHGQMPGMPVETEIINTSTIFNAEVYQGNLISRHSINIQPQVAGHIAKIYVKAGDKVQAGQLLIEIDKRKQESTLNSSKASYDVAQATLNNLEVQRKILQSAYEFNKQTYDRYKILYSKNTASKQDLDKYKDDYTKSKLDLDANDAQIKAQKAEIEKAGYTVKEQQVELEYYKIVAPYSGTIGDIPVKTGNYVTPQDSLLSISQNDRLELNIGLPSEKAFDIKKGLAVKILDNNGKAVKTSQISFISPVVDKDTQTILVKAIIDNKDELLKADQSIKTKVIYSQAPGIAIPAAAAVDFGGQNFVYIVNHKDKNTFVKQSSVKLGGLQDGKYVVIQGIKQGDEVVTAGVQKLMDNAPVMVTGKDN